MSPQLLSRAPRPWFFFFDCSCRHCTIAVAGAAVEASTSELADSFFIVTWNSRSSESKRDQDMLTSNVADLVPVEMPWTGTRRTPLILFETPYRQLIPFSMFDPDLSDANGLLMAKSGGGKTLAAQQMLLMAARANPLISILERGDSYQPLVELMGGEMIEMSLDSDQTINPWDLPRGEDRPSNDQISFLKNLTRHMLGENTPPDLDIDLLDSVLLEAITATRTTSSTSSTAWSRARWCAKASPTEARAGGTFRSSTAFSKQSRR